MSSVFIPSAFDWEERGNKSKSKQKLKKGIPFWRKSANDSMFQVRDALNKSDFSKINVEKVTLEELYQKYKKQLDRIDVFKDLEGVDHNSLYHLALIATKLNLYYVIEHDDLAYFSLGSSIRFNYRDRCVYIPYYTYKITEVSTLRKQENNPYLNIYDSEFDGRMMEVKYAYSKENLIVRDDLNAKSLETLALYSVNDNTLYVVNTSSSELSLLSKNMKNFSLTDLSQRYLYSSYFAYSNFSSELDEMEEKEKQSWSEESGNILKSMIHLTKKLTYKESKVRIDLGLPLFDDSIAESKNIGYKDMRSYDFSNCFEQEDIFDMSKVPLFKEPFWYRKVRFEAMLYGVLNTPNFQPIEEEYQDLYNELGKSKSSITFNIHNKPLILKHYYTPVTNYDKKIFRKKSYEQYKHNRKNFTYKEHSFKKGVII